LPLSRTKPAVVKRSSIGPRTHHTSVPKPFVDALAV
jgi:hypothetical protein